MNSITSDLGTLVLTFSQPMTLDISNCPRVPKMAPVRFRKINNTIIIGILAQGISQDAHLAEPSLTLLLGNHLTTGCAATRHAVLNLSALRIVTFLNNSPFTRRSSGISEVKYLVQGYNMLARPRLEPSLRTLRSLLHHVLITLTQLRCNGHQPSTSITGRISPHLTQALASNVGCSPLQVAVKSSRHLLLCLPLFRVQYLGRHSVSFLSSGYPEIYLHLHCDSFTFYMMSLTFVYYSPETKVHRTR